MFSDANGIKENSVKLGAGEDLYVLFAGILTMRPWNRVVDTAVDHLVIKGTDSDHSELQVMLLSVDVFIDAVLIISLIGFFLNKDLIPNEALVLPL